MYFVTLADICFTNLCLNDIVKLTMAHLSLNVFTASKGSNNYILFEQLGPDIPAEALLDHTTQFLVMHLQNPNGN